jgi:choline dehydrogenase-like flavoprotein
MRKDMAATAAEMLEAAGATEIELLQEENAPGLTIHEMGTARMGRDPKTSVLNAFNQMHEVKNLFVVDGSAFTTATEKNPTLSILALSWRATDFLAEEMRTGRI